MSAPEDDSSQPRRRKWGAPPVDQEATSARAALLDFHHTQAQTQEQQKQQQQQQQQRHSPLPLPIPEDEPASPKPRTPSPRPAPVKQRPHSRSDPPKPVDISSTGGDDTGPTQRIRTPSASTTPNPRYARRSNSLQSISFSDLAKKKKKPGTKPP